VLERAVTDGMKAEPGQTLFRLADMTMVWALVDVSERDYGRLRFGQPVVVRARALPSRTFSGKVSLIYPQINRETRTARVRVELANTDLALRPDMYVEADIAVGGGANVATVPDSAVVDSGKSQIVILDKGDGKFEPRAVKIGQRGDGRVEIREGVQDGDRVVTSANFLIDSESNLKAALKAFAPSKLPFPLLHVDTTWKFREMIAFRDETVKRLGVDLQVYTNEDGVRRGISPVASGASIHTQVMKTEALRQALDKGRFDAAFGGARRDEEKSRAKERIFSHRTQTHGWDPRSQRPELWRVFNTRLKAGESMRVFPLSNWTELDVWDYVAAEAIPVVPLYFAKPRPVV